MSLSPAIRFAWLSAVRQPARTCLAVAGVTAVGALLFDMLMLSRGLVVSFEDLLGRAGFDVRVFSTNAPPFAGPPLENAARAAARISYLPEVEAVLRLTVRDAEVLPDGAVERETLVDLIGADASARPQWTILEGRDLGAAPGAGPPLLVNRRVALDLDAAPGATLRLRGRCSEAMALPAASFTVVGIAEFPFDSSSSSTVAGTLADVAALCGEETDAADLLLVRSTARAGAQGPAAAIEAAMPGLHVVTNDQLVERFNRVEFSYFRQISFVLATVTLFFGFLLIAVLLTVSVNQRLGELAALRALGVSRRRVALAVLFESAILVSAGGVLAIPVGTALSLWLDSILRTMPGLPAGLHFFVFQPRALVLHALLLAAAAGGAAVYPMRIVVRLPIAATLRREVVS
jgi:putative ABC transport system permease protein